MREYLDPPPVTLPMLRARLADWGLNDDFPEWWEAWKQYDRHGTPPQAGGWLDWDIRLIEFFGFCYLLKAFHEIPQTPIPTLGNTW